MGDTWGGRQLTNGHGQIYEGSDGGGGGVTTGGVLLLLLGSYLVPQTQAWLGSYILNTFPYPNVAN